MKASELFVKSLEASGVRYIFGVPGEENLAFVEAVRDSSIELITTRHEQAAVFMAATYGRLTGRVGVALSTLGPGATNLVTGVAYAQLGGMPLMVITGQKPIKRSKQGRFQIIDVVGLMRPITKSAETIVSADRIPTSVYQAVRLAEAERPGAVHIELPEDIAEDITSEQPILWQKTRRSVADEKSILQLVHAVEVAKRPIIIVGSGANRKLIGKQLSALVEQTGIPFVTTQMGKGVVAEDSDRYLGTTALSDNDFVHEAIRAADLVLMLGHDVTEKPPAFAEAGQRVVHINFSAADIDTVYQPDLEVIGDISDTLWELRARLPGASRWEMGPFADFQRRQREDAAVESESDAFPIKPQRIVRDLRRVMPRDGVLSLDNGMYKLWISRDYPAYVHNTVLLDNALATMGAGVAVGIGVKLVQPETKTVVVTGDGGFIMGGLTELETAVRLGIDLVIVVLTDSGYGMIKWKQRSMGLDDFGLDFGNPDFVQLAQAFGATGHRVTAADEFEAVLREALERPGVHIIDVPIDYSENGRLDAAQLIERVRGAGARPESVSPGEAA